MLALTSRSQLTQFNRRPCANLNILIVGAGPVGLRTAIELSLLGGQVVVTVRGRDTDRAKWVEVRCGGLGLAGLSLAGLSLAERVLGWGGESGRGGVGVE